MRVRSWTVFPRLCVRRHRLVAAGAPWSKPPRRRRTSAPMADQHRSSTAAPCGCTATARPAASTRSPTCCATAAERLLDRLDDTTHPVLPRARPRRPRRGGAAAARAGHRRGQRRPLPRHGGAATARPCVAADEEWLPFAPASFDLVVASLSLHWVNDLPGALIQIRRALRPDGLLLASLPALGTLRRAARRADRGRGRRCRGGASPRVSPFPDLRDLRRAAAARRLRAAGRRCRGDPPALRRPARPAARPSRRRRDQCGPPARPPHAAARPVPRRARSAAPGRRPPAGHPPPRRHDRLGPRAGPAPALEAGQRARAFGQRAARCVRTDEADSKLSPPHRVFRANRDRFGQSRRFTC